MIFDLQWYLDRLNAEKDEAEFRKRLVWLLNVLAAEVGDLNERVGKLEGGNHEL